MQTHTTVYTKAIHANYKDKIYVRFDNISICLKNNRHDYSREHDRTECRLQIEHSN